MSRAGALIAPALLLVAGCSQESKEPEETPPTFHEVMKNEVDVRALYLHLRSLPNGS